MKKYKVKFERLFNEQQDDLNIQTEDSIVVLAKDKDDAIDIAEFKLHNSKEINGDFDELNILTVEEVQTKSQ